MIAAILHGKISRRIENAEDLLTSIVFGVLDLLPPGLGYAPLITTASYPETPSWATEVESVETVFWPWWDGVVGERGAEPDVVLIIKTIDRTRHLVVVEAKWRSGKSGEGGRDQLARQVRQARALASRYNARFAGLVYLTAHLRKPTADLERSLARIKADEPEHPAPDLWWTSWHELHRIFGAAATEAGTGASPELGRLANDACAALERWGLDYFAGVGRPKAVPTYRFSDEPHWPVLERIDGWRFDETR